MKQRQIYMSLAVLMTALAIIPNTSTATHAISVPNPRSMEPVPFGLPDDIFKSISAHVGFTFLGGEATEIVYRDTGSSDKLSELIWELQGITMIGGVASMEMPVLLGLRISCGLWLAASQDSGEMTDYDWIYEGRDWSHRSISDLTLEQATMFDLNMSAKLFEIRSIGFRLMAGLKTDFWSWEDWNGTYIYSSGGGFRNNPGTFDEEVGITYEQLFVIPYAGASVEATFGSLGVSGYLTMSPIVYGQDKDHHRLRDLHFEETFAQGDYVGVGATAAWSFNDHFYAMAALEHQSIPTVRGDTYIVEGDQDTEDNAGADNTITTFSLSIGAQL